MTLRLRLVIALVALVTAAQGGFFVATYGLFRGSEYQRLDSQLRSSEPLIDQQLDEAASFTEGNRPAPGAGRGPAGPGGTGGPTVVPIPGTYAQPRSPAGAVLSHIQVSPTRPHPPLTSLPSVKPSRTLLHVGPPSGTRAFPRPAAPGPGP